MTGNHTIQLNIMLMKHAAQSCFEWHEDEAATALKHFRGMRVEDFAQPCLTTSIMNHSSIQRLPLVFSMSTYNNV